MNNYGTIEENTSLLKENNNKQQIQEKIKNTNNIDPNDTSWYVKIASLFLSVNNNNNKEQEQSNNHQSREIFNSSSNNTITSPQTENMNQKSSSYSNISEISSFIIDEKTSVFDLYKGLFFMFISCIFKSLYSVFSKLLLIHNTEISSSQLLVLKSYVLVIISTILLYLFLNIKYEKLLVNNQEVFYKVVLRSLFSVVSNSILIYSLKEIAISEVFTVYYTYPCIIIILSFFILKEHPKKLDVTCLIACIIGVLLIIRPYFIDNILSSIYDTGSNNEAIDKESDSKNIIITLFAALIKASEDLIVKSIGNEVEPIFIPIMYSFIGVMIYPLIVYFTNQSLSFITKLDILSWFMIIIISAFSFLMLLFLAKSLQNESASRVSMVNYLQIVFMFGSDLFIFGRSFYLWDILGMLLIFGFNFGNGLFKFYQRLDKKEKCIKRNEE